MLFDRSGVALFGLCGDLFDNICSHIRSLRVSELVGDVGIS